MKQNILFTCAGRRNYLINYFKEALDGEGLVLAADQDPTAAALIDADKALILPSFSENNYLDELFKTCIDHRVSAIISLNDHELPLLTENRKRFEDEGIKILVSNSEVIDITYDKWKTHEFLVSNGFNSPKSFRNYQDVVAALDSGQINFPIVIKPRWGSASIGIEYVHSSDELHHINEVFKLRLGRQSIGDHKQQMIYQEKLNGIEYGMDVLNDFEGNYVGSLGRVKLNMRGGETDKAESIVNKDLTAIGARLGRSLKHIGTMDCDIFRTDDKFYVLELNPRFGGGYPFSHEAGCKTCNVYVDWLNARTDIMRHINYKPGLIFSKCDRMIKVVTSSN